MIASQSFKIIKMNSTITFVSNNNNHYCFDYNKKMTLHVSPIFTFLVYLMESNVNITEWLNTQNEIINSEPFGQVTKMDILRQIAYIDHLKENGWFTQFCPPKILATRITSSQINRQLINLKQILFEVTDGCNLKCTYCGYGELYEDYDSRKSKLLSYKKAPLPHDCIVWFK
jgi:uncharacterized membrane protein